MLFTQSHPEVPMTINYGRDKNGIQNNILGVGWGEHQINIQHQIYQSAHILPYIKAIHTISINSRNFKYTKP